MGLIINEVNGDTVVEQTPSHSTHINTPVETIEVRYRDTERVVMSSSANYAPAGPPGPAGIPGPQGPKGDTGPAGTTDWDGITDKPTEFPPGEHQHPVTDLSGVVKTVNGTGPDAAGDVVVEGGSSAGLTPIAPQHNDYFSSPLLYNGITDKPRGFTGATFFPPYGVPVAFDQVNIWVNTPGNVGDTADVVLYPALADGRPDLANPVVSVTIPGLDLTGRKGVNIPTTQFPETGMWSTVNLPLAGARLRCANSMLFTTGVGAGSGPAFNLGAAWSDPNNGGNPCIVALKAVI